MDDGPCLVLDSGLWALLWVIGAIVLIVLIIVAASQVPSSPKKGNATPEATVATVWTGSGTGGWDQEDLRRGSDGLVGRLEGTS